MKIALPSEGGNVNPHFGKSREFTIVELQDGQIVDRKTISATNLQHNHEGLAGLMTSEKVDVVIVGGIGAMALQALEQSGLRVIYGASGNIDDVVGAFARGELVSQGSGCCSHHHGAHGGGCHHHGHGGGCSH